MEKPPDIVVSGINHGGTFANNIIYSGTVSGATEGTLLGIPSIALSMDSFLSNDFASAVSHGVDIVKRVAKKGLPEGTLLNVNFPDPELDVKGFKVCRQSGCKFSVTFEKRHDPRGLDYYWQGGEMDHSDPDKETDVHALKKGFITITPIRYDLTDYKFMDELKTWDF